MNHVYGKVTAGVVSIECNCDTTQLDEALEKAHRLIASLQEAQTLSSNLPLPLLPVGLLATTVAINGVSSTRKLSRRSLFTFWRK